MRYAEVAVHTQRPYRQGFTYSVPDGLSLAVGQTVLVPFGSRVLQGIVLAIATTTAFDGAVRPLLCLDPELPSLLPQQAALARWLSRHYLAPLFDCVALMLPPGASRRPLITAAAVARDTDVTDVSEAERELLEALRRDPAGVQPQLTRPNNRALTRGLLARGLLRSEQRLAPPRRSCPERWLRLTAVGEAAKADVRLLLELRGAGGALPLREARRRSAATPARIRSLIQAGLLEEYTALPEADVSVAAFAVPAPAPRLTPAQVEAVERILDGDEQTARKPVLLHGVTGSGKTEVYLQLVAQVLRRGESAIVLVPEIALAPQAVERFAGRFPGQVVVLHSGLSDGQRYDRWQAVRSGRASIVVGSRSALFAPVTNLGCVILDEEHEWTYKQQETQPRYHTREVAEQLARLSGARLVLGSATPDIVTYHRADRGRYMLVQLRERAPAGVQPTEAPPQLPSVEVIDLARELRDGNRGIFSRRLQTELRATLARGEQAILFLNRRGSAGFILCRDCGHVPRCRRCAVSLTYHAKSSALVCHQCGWSQVLPMLCSACGSARMRPLGLGTQRVEEEVRRLFPHARVLRWDRDVARTAEQHAAFYQSMLRSEADILVGTQLVAKSLDLPRVTLVGVISADVSLNMPDYLSGERSFQLLTQVAGRAGRRADRGRVIVQTYAPNSYVVKAASAHDYAAFFQREIEFRRRAAYPPFTGIARLVYASSSARQAETEARRLAEELRARLRDRYAAGSAVLGPAPCPVARLRGRWRWQILLRGSDPAAMLDGVALPRGWNLDIDPRSFS